MDCAGSRVQRQFCQYCHSYWCFDGFHHPIDGGVRLDQNINLGGNKHRSVIGRGSIAIYRATYRQVRRSNSTYRRGVIDCGRNGKPCGNADAALVLPCFHAREIGRSGPDTSPVFSCGSEVVLQIPGPGDVHNAAGEFHRWNRFAASCATHNRYIWLAHSVVNARLCHACAWGCTRFDVGSTSARRLRLTYGRHITAKRARDWFTTNAILYRIIE